MAAIVAYPDLKALMADGLPSLQRRAALLGLRGLVFKSHGSADAMAFEQALNRAYDAARNNLPTVSGPGLRTRPLLAPADGPTPAWRCGDRTIMRRYSRITGTGSYLPHAGDQRRSGLQNWASAASKPSDEWIVERTGIRRATLPRQMSRPATSVWAARNALEAANLQPRTLI